MLASLLQNYPLINNELGICEAEIRDIYQKLILETFKITN